MNVKPLTLYVALLAALCASLNANATLHTWTGGASGNDTRWTLQNNWAGSSRPLAGDDLIFPAGASHPNNINDYPTDTTFNSIIIGGNNYFLNGSSITLNAGILVTNSGNGATLNDPLILNSNQSFTVAATSSGLNLTGAIDNNGKDLTMSPASPALVQALSVISGAGGLIKT